MNRKTFLLISLLIALVSPPRLFAQTPFRLFPNPAGVRVMNPQGTDSLPLPWAGGLLNPQYSNIDLNLDGRQDIFIFEPADGKVTTLLNQGGNKFEHAPDYESAFPVLQGWALLNDYNKDGKADIFTYSARGFGIDVYINTGTTAGPVFKKIHDRIKYKDIGFSTEVYAGSNDIPAFADVDGDGDLDILAFDVVQSLVQYYQNTAKEDGLSPDTIKLRIADRCWGKFATTFHDTVELNKGCGRVMKREKHGASSLLVRDLDGDGDMDMLMGNLFFPGILELTNGRIQNGQTIHPVDSMIAQHRNWPSSNKPVNITVYPVPFLLDVDDNKKLDIVVSPQALDESQGENQSWLYINAGTEQQPEYRHVLDNYLQVDMLHGSNRCAPLLWDYDSDGLQDLLFTAKGNSSALYQYDKFILYRNTGNRSQAVFTKVADPFLDIADKQYSWTRAASADLNGDLKPDLLIGKADGTLSYYRHDGVQNNVPIMTEVTEKYQDIDGGQDASPALADIDGDGKTDLLLGRRNGTIAYYRNTGSTSSPVFQLVTENFGRVRTNGFYYEYIFDPNTGDLIDSVLRMEPNGHSSPAVADMDRDGKPDLISGSTNGSIFYFPDVRSGINDSLQRRDSIFFNRRTESLEEKDFGLLALPAVGDLNGDTLPELVIGTYRGGMNSYGSRERQIILGLPDLSDQSGLDMKVYPNPADLYVYIQLNGSTAGGFFRIYNSAGQSVGHGSLNAASGHAKLDIRELPAGLYTIRVISHDGRIGTQKLMIE